ncbi:MAG TPA: hypothetical protein GX521_07495 [Firmicutes bacterium]|nr:hypothetical protein [Bacillota bacterium]
MNNKEIPVGELGELMDMMAEKMPGLLKDMFDTIFSEEAAIHMSKAVGTFYRNLVEAGMEEHYAMSLTQEYLNTFKSMTSNLKGS